MLVSHMNFRKGQKHKRKVNPSKTSSSGEASVEAEPKVCHLLLEFYSAFFSCFIFMLDL